MKKTYLNPTTDVMYVGIQLMQNASPTQGGVNTGDKPGDEYDPDAPSYSRKTVWDEEEEEEEY